MTPKQPSMMPELLQKITPIPVSTLKDAQTIEPDHIYVVPPGKELAVYKGKIQLLDMVRGDVVLPIDFFFRSLAQDQGGNAAAIILSGTGTDGTLGVKEIKANDGLVFVQQPKSAIYGCTHLHAHWRSEKSPNSAKKHDRRNRQRLEASAYHIRYEQRSFECG